MWNYNWYQNKIEALLNPLLLLSCCFSERERTSSCMRRDDTFSASKISEKCRKKNINKRLKMWIRRFRWEEELIGSSVVESQRVSKCIFIQQKCSWHHWLPSNLFLCLHYAAQFSHFSLIVFSWLPWHMVFLHGTYWFWTSWQCKYVILRHLHYTQHFSAAGHLPKWCHSGLSQAKALC